MTTHTLINSSHDVFTFASSDGRSKSFPVSFLTQSLPDIETIVFFAKVYKLDAHDLSRLMSVLLPTNPVVEALTNEAYEHSTTLQDFLVNEFVDSDGEWYMPDLEFFTAPVEKPEPVNAEVLPELFKQAEMVIADSIATVAESISDVISHMPGRTGEMTFRTMATMNAKRPTIGDHKAVITHQQQKQVLVVFDVSGSMTEETVRTIVDDVVGLAYEANASLAIVSNSAYIYDPGGFTTRQVLEDAQYAGTHYEMLVPLFKQTNWDLVITIADYDSSPSAKHALSHCNGRIAKLLDVSLVDRSTYLAECLAQMADEVQPLLIASRPRQFTW